MQASVIVFPGSNCDRDVAVCVEAAMGKAPLMAWHGDATLPKSDLIVLPGGFSYGDYLRSGAIARFSPIMEKVIEFANNGGYVMGVCNGFQILCESGLLPGALLHNNSHKFICKNVYLSTVNNTTCITDSIIREEPLCIPIAHGEGRYFADADTLKQLNDNDQVLFRYCDSNGNITDDSNPNGAVENIAGICNAGRNVFGMMPHPERASDLELGNNDGGYIFQSIISVLELA